eukprot:scaffold45695_cov21-Tisochrysis_lutea.AAC.3
MRDWIGSLFYTRTWRSPSHTRSQGCTVRGSQSVVSAPVAIVCKQHHVIWLAMRATQVHFCPGTSGAPTSN